MTSSDRFDCLRHFVFTASSVSSVHLRALPIHSNASNACCHLWCIPPPPPLPLMFHLCVRGHPSVSSLPLSSPTFYLCICIPPPHLCTISKDRTYSWRLLGPMVQQLPRSRLTNSHRLPVSPSARTSTASDGLRMHWDRFAWCYGTLCHHVDNHIWEAWY
jgi:hypothetical protein